MAGLSSGSRGCALRRRRGSTALAAAVALTAAGALAGPASAAFPGVNGKIAFDRNGDIVVKEPGDLTGGTPIATAGENADAAWSPDGLRLAFVSDRAPGGGLQVWTMNADGGNPVQLTFESGDVSAPSWSPDGTRIAYDVSVGTDDRDVAVIPVAGGSARIFVAGGPGDQKLPVFTPDGGRIIFEDSTVGGLSVVGATGAGRAAFLADAAQPDFSPEGGRLVVRRTDILRAFVVNADGTGGRIVEPDRPAIRPVWSPDGTRIVYHRFVSSGPPPTHRLFTVDSNGGTETPETTFDGLDFSADWQPIGAVPVITGLPSPLTAGLPGATLAVDGRGFAFRSVVRWNGSDRPTTWVSPTRVTARLTAADVAAPGSAQVTVFTSPSGGGLSAPFAAVVPAPPPPPPRILLGSSRVTKATWKLSRVKGSFQIAGSLERSGNVEVALVRGARVAQRRVLALPAGPFNRLVRLAPGLLPGRYVVRLQEVGPPAGAAALLATQGAITLPAPPEGVVSTRSVSALQNGPPARTLRGASRIFATFRFATLPKASRRITARWIGPGGARTDASGKPRRRVVSSFVSRRGGLPAGVWRCELRGGGRLVAVATVRLRG